MASPANRSKVFPGVIIATVDVIHFCGGAYAPAFHAEFANPVCFQQYSSADLIPVVGQSVAAAGRFPPHRYTIRSSSVYPALCAAPCQYAKVLAVT